ncbi:ComEC/Rec2 family competence protein [Microbulbifer sp. TRSA002]|uniref:ComEC/Rec2 family competence protein n=1 Tax=Microbulbifer sp. TRSA002 TaxID=3243382 RepID=UPI004039FAAF
MAKFQFKILKASHGDCIIIQGKFDGQERNILIDGGPAKTFKRGGKKGELLKELEFIDRKKQKVDLLILTHVDEDHIGGLLKGFRNNGILSRLTVEVWFNSGSLIDHAFNQEVDPTHLLTIAPPSNTNSFTSIKQGLIFEEHIREKGIWNEELIISGTSLQRFGITFTIISPTEEKLEKLLGKWEKETSNWFTGSNNGDHHIPLDHLLKNEEPFKEDNTIHNGSSIAFIFEYNNKKILFLSDAHNEVIVRQLKKLGHSEKNPLKVNYVKLSHHGSKYNTSTELLDIIDCSNFIISSDTSRFKLPNKATISRIIKHKPNSTIYFNYPEIINEKIFSSSELDSLQKMKIKLKPCKDPFEL